jgi:hypothetical protein
MGIGDPLACMGNEASKQSRKNTAYNFIISSFYTLWIYAEYLPYYGWRLKNK